MAQRGRKAWLLAGLVLTVALAGCTGVSPGTAPGSGLGGSGGGSGAGSAADPPLQTKTVSGNSSGTSGGVVSLVAPTWTSFNSTLTSADNSGGSQEVWTGVVFDANGEADLQTLKLRFTGPLATNFTHTITSTEGKATTQPAFGADGFSVWSGAAKNDGILQFQFRTTYPIGTPAGTVTITPSVVGGTGASVNGTADTTTITVFSQITIAPSPVDAAGNATANNWGLWTATPGAGNVASANYVKLTNTGQKSAAQVVLSFSNPNFTGADDANYSIPINGNVQFAWFEDKTPGTTSPTEGTFTFGGTSPDGSVTVQFSGLGNIIYVQYRTVSFPPVLAAQSYGASYTATEL